MMVVSIGKIRSLEKKTKPPGSLCIKVTIFKRRFFFTLTVLPMVLKIFYAMTVLYIGKKKKPSSVVIAVIFMHILNYFITKK